MPRVIRCPNCQAPLTVDVERPVLRCDYCGADIKQTVALPPIEHPQQQRRQRQQQQPSPQPVVAPAPFPPAVAPRSGMSGAVKAIIWMSVLTTILPIIVVAVIAIGGLSKIGTALSSATRTVSRTVTTLTGGATARARRGVPASEPEPEQLLGEKLAPYVEACLNRHVDGVRMAREGYRDWQPDEQGGPTCKERYIERGVRQLQVSQESYDCEAQIKVVAAKTPRLSDVEPAGAAFVTALNELAPILAAAHRYYDQKDYKDDGCAKGKTLHAQLVPAFARFAAAEATLRGSLERQLVPLLERRLARATAENRQGALQAYLKLLLDVRRLQGLLRGRLEGPGSDGDGDAIKALVAVVDEDITSFAAADKRQPNATPLGAAEFATWAQGHALEYLKAVKELTRRGLKGPATDALRLGAPGNLTPRAKRQLRMRRGRSSGNPLDELVSKYNTFLRDMRAPLPNELQPKGS